MLSTIPTPDSAAAARRRGLARVGALTLVVGVLLVYANTFSVPFLLDDTKSILENPTIRHLWPLGDALNPPADSGFGGRPLANLSLALNWALGESRVTGYHGLNLAIHLLAGLALFAAARRLVRLREPTGSGAPDHAALIAGLTAALWLLHPLLTGAVTYISQRTETLMALAYLSTIYGFLRGAEAGSKRWLAGSIAACAAGMLCKEVMATAPIVALLLDRQFFAGTVRAALVQRRAYYVGLAATWLLLAVSFASGLSQRGVGYLGISPWTYLVTECGALLTYLRLAVWPSPLIFDYGPIFVRDFSSAALPCVVVAAAIGTTILAWRRRSLAGLAGAIFLLILTPTSSVVPVAAQPIAESRMYLPLAVLALAAVAGSFQLVGRRAVAVWVMAALGFGVIAQLRNADYHSTLTLWRDSVAKRPGNARAHASLGSALVESGDLAGGIRAYERSLTLDGNAGDTHNNLATALIDASRGAEAAAHFRASLALRPNVASTHYNFGNLLLQLGQPAESAAEHRRALGLQPDLGEAHAGLAAALAATGNSADAIASYTKAVELRPDLAAAHLGLANLLAGANRLAEAVPHYEATLRAFPGAAEVRFNYATVLAIFGRSSDAIAEFETVLRLKPDFPGAKENLAKLRALTTPSLR